MFQVSSKDKGNYSLYCTFFIVVGVVLFALVLVGCKSEQTRLAEQRQSAIKEIGSDSFPITPHFKTNGVKFIAGIVLVGSEDVVNKYWPKELDVDTIYKEIIPTHEISSVRKDGKVFPLLFATGMPLNKNGRYDLVVELSGHNSAMKESIRFKPFSVSNSSISSKSNNFVLLGPLPSFEVIDEFDNGGSFAVKVVLEDKVEGRKIKFSRSVTISK